MKKTKLIIIPLILATTIGIGITLPTLKSIDSKVKVTQTQTQTAEKSPSLNVVLTSASMPYYEDVAELEKQATHIVIGKVIGEQQNVEIKDPETGTVFDRRAFVPFSITKAIKGSYTDGQEITISENGLIHNNSYQTLEGYARMNNEDDYLLFLEEVEPAKFKIVGSHQGKFNTSKTRGVLMAATNEITTLQLEDVDFFGDAEEAEHFNKLKNEALSTYIE